MDRFIDNHVPARLFSDVRDVYDSIALAPAEYLILANEYNAQDLPVDRLPYTGNFEQIYRCFQLLTWRGDVSRHHLNDFLLFLRKASESSRERNGLPQLKKQGRSDVIPTWWE